MKKYLIAIFLALPFSILAQLVLGDTIIKGISYKIFPFNVSSNYMVRTFEGLNSFQSLVQSIPSVPSITDSLPDGDYIILYRSEDRIYLNTRRLFLKPNYKSVKVKSFIYAKFTIKSGVKAGLCTLYDSKRNVIAEGYYGDDIKQGEWNYYSGNQFLKVHFTNGSLQGKVTVKKGKNVLCKTNVVDGKIDGEYLEYYDNGRPKIITKIVSGFHFSDGEYPIRASQNFDSVYNFYYKNGQLSYSQLCSNGFYHNSLVEYDENGDVVSIRKALSKDSDNYILEIKEFDASSGKLWRRSLMRSERYSFNNIQLINKISYYDNGDTMEIENGQKRMLAGFPIDYDSLISINKVYSVDGKLEFESFTHSYFNYINYNNEPFRNTYYASGKPRSINMITYNKSDNSFNIKKSVCDTSGRFVINNYLTYQLHIADVGVSGELKDTTFEKIPGSDTMDFYYDGKPFTKLLYVPVTYKVPEKLRSKQKLKFFFKNKKKTMIDQAYEKQFSWESDEFIIKTVPRVKYSKAYTKKHRYSWTSYDSITILIPFAAQKGKPNQCVIGESMKSIDIVNGKLNGLFDAGYGNIFTYKSGIKEGPCEDYSSRGYYKRGLLNGQFVEFESQQEEVEDYSNNMGHHYKISKIMHYKNDTLNGPYVEYDYATGQPNLSVNYKSGKMDGPYIKINPANNDTLLIAHFSKGLLNGQIESYAYKVIENEYRYGTVYNIALITLGNDRPLLKSYTLNINNGVYKGKQLFYGKSGYLLHEVMLSDEATVEQHTDDDNVESLVSTNMSEMESAEGYHKYFYKSGIVAEEGVMKQDKKVGIWKTYDEDGTLYRLRDFNSDFASDTFPGLNEVFAKGTINTYHRNGKLYEQGYILDVESKYDCNQERDLEDEVILYAAIYDSTGKALLNMGTGDINIYFHSGLRKAKGRQVGGFREGFWIFFDPNGNPIQAGNYVHGEKDGRWLAGDLRGFHFIDNQCFSDDIDAELMKIKAESNLEIEEHFYKLGQLISSSSVRVDKK